MRPQLPILAALLLAPLGVAAGSFEADGVLRPDTLYRNSYAFGEAHEYVVTASEGDIIEATLTWSDPAASLYLRFASFAPCRSELECTFPASLAWCAQSASGAAEGRQQVVHYEARASSGVQILVAARFAAFEAPYHLSMTLNGEAPAVEGPAAGNYVLAASATCSLAP